MITQEYHFSKVLFDLLEFPLTNDYSKKAAILDVLGVLPLFKRSLLVKLAKYWYNRDQQVKISKNWYFVYRFTPFSVLTVFLTVILNKRSWRRPLKLQIKTCGLSNFSIIEYQLNRIKTWALTVKSLFSFKMAAMTSLIMLMSKNSVMHMVNYRESNFESFIEISPLV